MKTQNIISKIRIKRIKAQGYNNFTDLGVSELSFGNRFAYILCSSILLIGIVTANIPILSAMLIIAFSTILLPYHPFDYIYNHGLRFVLNKPKLPRRSHQLKFACLIATVNLFYNENMTAGYIVGTCLIFSAVLVSTTDICLPSVLYNSLFRKK